jgi:hypothetical protein
VFEYGPSLDSRNAPGGLILAGRDCWLLYYEKGMAMQILAINP